MVLLMMKQVRSRSRRRDGIRKKTYLGSPLLVMMLKMGVVWGYVGVMKVMWVTSGWLSQFEGDTAYIPFSCISVAEWAGLECGDASFFNRKNL